MKSADRIVPSPFFSGSATTSTLLKEIGVDSLDDLFRSIPVAIQDQAATALQDEPWQGADEWEVAAWFEEAAGKNKIWPADRFWVGAGAYRYPTPSTVLEIFKRSEFLTSYTPYQPEISQGNLQGLFEFQTIVAWLMGLDLANASLYDGPTAAAEAILSALRINRKSHTVAVSNGLSGDLRKVVKLYLSHVDCEQLDLPFDAGTGTIDCSVEADIYLIGYPNGLGVFEQLKDLRAAHPAATIISYTPDPHALALVVPPGEAGADIAVAEGQAFGLPVGFGGPYLGLFACTTKFLRQIPGRLCGQTTDRDGKPGFVLTLSTREQHIRREKATSNICSNQGILTLAFSAYAATMGWSGLRKMAGRVWQLRHRTEQVLSEAGFELSPGVRYNEFFVGGSRGKDLAAGMLSHGYRLGIDAQAIVPEAPQGILVAVPSMINDSQREHFISTLSQVVEDLS